MQQYYNIVRQQAYLITIEKSIDAGYKVCLFPENTKGKDINEMIQNQLTADEIKGIIDNNTVNGLGAKLKFTHWKRC